MWTITVFEKDTHRIFEYETKQEATNALKNFSNPAILTFTY